MSTAWTVELLKAQPEGTYLVFQNGIVFVKSPGGDSWWDKETLAIWFSRDIAADLIHWPGLPVPIWSLS